MTNPARDWPRQDITPPPMADEWRRGRFERSREDGWSSVLFCVKCGSLKVDTLFSGRVSCLEPGCTNSSPLDPECFGVVGGIAKPGDYPC